MRYIRANYRVVEPRYRYVHDATQEGERRYEAMTVALSVISCEISFVVGTLGREQGEPRADFTLLGVQGPLQ